MQHTPDDERALAQYRAQARRAEQATLWEDAARAYEQALSLIAGDADAAADEAGLLTALGRCYWLDGQARPAWRTLRRAIALCRDRGDAVGVARATVELLAIWGPPDRQRAMADEALDLLGDADPHLRAWLLLRTRRQDEALEIAERHGLEDVLPARLNERAWRAIDEGRPDEFIAVLRHTHELYAAMRLHDVAAGQLRGAGFAMMQLGRLGAGITLAEEAMAYASRTHLRFHQQLALMDLAGAAFARCEFDRCAALLDETPGEVDFRADLYRMWVAHHRGDTEQALRLLVDPVRGGGAQTAVSQIHAAAAGMLFAAGQHDAAKRELEAWAEVARVGQSFVEEAAAPADCLVALGGDALVLEVRQAFAERDGRLRLRDRYSTLQGRGLDDVRGALALRLGASGDAAAHFREGLAWAEEERCPVDAGRCLLGLADVALRQGRPGEAQPHVVAAAALFARVGAVHELRRARARRTQPA